MLGTYHKYNKLKKYDQFEEVKDFRRRLANLTKFMFPKIHAEDMISLIDSLEDNYTKFIRLPYKEVVIELKREVYGIKSEEIIKYTFVEIFKEIDIDEAKNKMNQYLELTKKNQENLYLICNKMLINNKVEVLDAMKEIDKFVNEINISHVFASESIFEMPVTMYWTKKETTFPFETEKNYIFCNDGEVFLFIYVYVYYKKTKHLIAADLYNMRFNIHLLLDDISTIGFHINSSYILDMIHVETNLILGNLLWLNCKNIKVKDFKPSKEHFKKNEYKQII